MHGQLASGHHLLASRGFRVVARTQPAGWLAAARTDFFLAKEPSRDPVF